MVPDPRNVISTASHGFGSGAYGACRGVGLSSVPNCQKDLLLISSNGGAAYIVRPKAIL